MGHVVVQVLRLQSSVAQQQMRQVTPSGHTILSDGTPSDAVAVAELTEIAKLARCCYNSVVAVTYGSLWGCEVGGWVSSITNLILDVYRVRRYHKRLCGWESGVCAPL